MAPRGRRPAHPEDRARRGNPSKRAAAKPPPEPAPLDELAPPHFLKGEAAREWNRVAPELHRLGRLTVVDRTALAVYCRTYARWLAVEAALDDEDLVLEGLGEKGSYSQQRPEVGIAKHLAAQLKAYASEFGLTPASRARVPGKAPDDQKSKLAAFNARRGGR